MKKNKLSQYILILLCITSSATMGFTTYTAPTATAPNANTDGVLTTSIKTEVKSGDLKLNGAFYANSASYFAQDITILDQINGGLQTGMTKSIFTVGSGTNPMNASITGFLRTNNIQADSLKPVPGITYQTMTRNDGTIVNKVCVDKTGKLSLCTTTPPPPAPKAKITNISFSLNSTASGANCSATLDVSNLANTTIQPNTTYYKIQIEGYEDYQDCEQLTGGPGQPGCKFITSRAAYTCAIDIKGQDTDFQPNPPEAYVGIFSTNQIGWFQYKNDPTVRYNENGRMPNTQGGPNLTMCVVDPSSYGGTGAQYDYIIDPTITTCL